MRRSFISCALFLFAIAASAATVPELFQKAKDQFRLRAYSDALATLEKLERESEKPKAQSLRDAMRPGLAFYRGASLAALGREEEARPHFEIYLAHQPSAALDPAIYPKAVIRALEKTKSALVQRDAGPESPTSLASAYRGFPQPPSSPEDRLEDWAEGPVRFLLTSDERQAFSRLTDPVSRSEFLAQFWKSHDPRPESPENELRLEFEKRVAFADSRFTQEETRGALTDRGMVFVLLGPPTWIGRKPLKTGDDVSDNIGVAKSLQPAHNWTEVWHYRRELLPRGVPYHQVDFDFLTRRGYGTNVLQREDQSLKTLEAARRAEPAWFVGNKASR